MLARPKTGKLMVRYVGDTTETFRLDLGVGALASVSALSKLLYQVALSGVRA